MERATADTTRDAIVQRIRMAMEEIEEYFRDVEAWNSEHPGEEPIDGDPDGRLRRLYDSYTECLRNEARLSLEGKI